MVEVFKTSVQYRSQANILVEQIHKTFPTYIANFDLEDCDKILRVECLTGMIQSHLLMTLLEDFGYTAEFLPDDEQFNVQIHTPYALYN